MRRGDLLPVLACAAVGVVSVVGAIVVGAEQALARDRRRACAARGWGGEEVESGTRPGRAPLDRPYGGNASPDPFPGAICQLVGAADTPDRPRVQQRVFGRNRSHDAPGVHAPN